jgi:hypothetical protein
MPRRTRTQSALADGTRTRTRKTPPATAPSLRGFAASRLRVRPNCPQDCAEESGRGALYHAPHFLAPSRGDGCYCGFPNQKTQNPPLAPNGGEGSGVRGTATLNSHHSALQQAEGQCSGWKARATGRGLQAIRARQCPGVWHGCRQFHCGPLGFSSRRRGCEHCTMLRCIILAEAHGASRMRQLGGSLALPRSQSGDSVDARELPCDWPAVLCEPRP